MLHVYSAGKNTYVYRCSFTSIFELNGFLIKLSLPQNNLYGICFLCKWRVNFSVISVSKCQIHSWKLEARQFLIFMNLWKQRNMKKLKCSLHLKVTLFRNVFGIFKSPQNERKYSTLLLLWYLKSTCFHSFFGRNWRLQKDIL